MVYRVVFITVFFAFIVFNKIQEKRFLKSGHEVRGNLPIKKGVFVIGKLTLLLSWFVAVVQAFGFNMRMFSLPESFMAIASTLFLLGFIIVIISYTHLGDANSMGLPNKMTSLKKHGIYTFSRNPLYLGLFVMIMRAAFFRQPIKIMTTTSNF